MAKHSRAKPRKKRWWDRRDMSKVKEYPVTGGRMRVITTNGKEVPMFIPDTAFERQDPVEWEGFMGLNQLMVRFLARKFPNTDTETNVCRAHAASMAAWIDPPAAIEHLESGEGKFSGKEEHCRILQLEMLELINETFGDKLSMEDVQTQSDIKEIILEMWDQAPPSLIPQEYMSLPMEERVEKIDHVMEYTMYLHEHFKHIDPMIRAEVASNCAQFSAKEMLKAARPFARPMVEALFRRYESN